MAIYCNHFYTSDRASSARWSKRHPGKDISERTTASDRCYYKGVTGLKIPRNNKRNYSMINTHTKKP